VADPPSSIRIGRKRKHLDIAFERNLRQKSSLALCHQKR
jgi:hypothetical protein